MIEDYSRLGISATSRISIFMLQCTAEEDGRKFPRGSELEMLLYCFDLKHDREFPHYDTIIYNDIIAWVLSTPEEPSHFPHIGEASASKIGRTLSIDLER